MTETPNSNPSAPRRALEKVDRTIPWAIKGITTTTKSAITGTLETGKNAVLKIGKDIAGRFGKFHMRVGMATVPIAGGAALSGLNFANWALNLPGDVLKAGKAVAWPVLYARSKIWSLLTGQKGASQASFKEAALAPLENTKLAASSQFDILKYATIDSTRSLVSAYTGFYHEPLTQKVNTAAQAATDDNFLKTIFASPQAKAAYLEGKKPRHLRAANDNGMQAAA